MRHKLRLEKDSLVIEELFNNLNIWTKIKDGSLRTQYLDGSPSNSYPGTSRILLHYDANGNHIATRVFSNYKDNRFYGFQLLLESNFLIVIVGLDPTIQTLLNNLI